MKSGFKRVTIKLVLADGTERKRVYRAQPHMLYSERAVEQILWENAVDLEKHMPEKQFRLVQIAPNAFNLIEIVEEKSSEAVDVPIAVGRGYFKVEKTQS